MDRFEYTIPVLEYNEDHVTRARNIKLYDGDQKTSHEGGELVLTTHRIWWASPGTIDQGLMCLSLPLYYVVFIEEEIPSAFAFTRSSKLVLHLSAARVDKKSGPVQVSPYNFVKLSFKDGLEDRFVNLLRNTLALKKWEILPQQFATAPPTKAKLPEIKTRTGIVGIERTIQEKQKATDESISAAFKDLNKLMNMAKDMVTLSKTISTKIREKQGNITENETIQFKSYLLSLGIDDPVTRDTFSSESSYIENLARQLVEILEGPIKEQGGMMSLADAFCRVNRARGLELLSPEDMLRASKTLEKLNLPIKLRTFDSGVMVLQLQSLNDSSVVEATLAQLKENGSLSPEEVSHASNISILLAKERLATTEKLGYICRDESIEGLRFYPNLFAERAV
ncbi:vacuolar protein-sorting-associated protein 36 [Cimex lectularius]|uniref:Vacuolar protein-sorting-associated protein 36 n=1 Tax=Cimex lectularius TaxID=79782 RepID=A0A8I6S051_CIMLE|nr:vacuolar protein-sorting-associated protein 36 [Cimex lectularius]